METSDRKQQLLRQYVERNLHGDDLAEFRKLAQTDINFRREAELERRISQAIEQGRREKFQQHFNYIKANNSLDKRRIVSIGNWSSPLSMLVAASVLVMLTFGFLYLFWQFRQFSEPSIALDKIVLDTTSQQPVTQENGEMLMVPKEVDTSSQPAPVDLSQATPPADAPEANAQAEEVAEDNRETTDGKPGPNESAAVEKPAAEKPKEEKQKEEVAVENPKIKPSGVASSYTVGAGETFYSVANRYNMKVSTLKEMNPGVSESDLKAGVTKLKVKVMAVHTVGPGDVLRVVAQKYGVSKEAIMRANKKDKDIATRGEKLIIPFPEKK